MDEEEPSQSQNQPQTQENQEVQLQKPVQGLEYEVAQQEYQQYPEPVLEPEPEQQQQQQHDQEVDEHEPEGMNLSPTHVESFARDIISSDLIPESPPQSPPNVARKAPKKKKRFSRLKEVAMEKKLQILKENMRPIPFIPTKTLDFSKHEKLLKRLGLWDFVHLVFDRDIRIDLLAPLITYFNPALRYSFVNDIRIMVNRADLGRALKLPVKKDKAPLEVPDLDSEELSEEAISFLGDFLSNWVLLHEDTWMMPEDILTGARLIKTGHPHKVDWAGLIWYMVEKELLKGPQLECCYYASHLQYLIKSQREDLFKEEPRLEISIKDDEDMVDVRSSDLHDFPGQDLEKQQVELSLGQEKIEMEQVRDEDDMDFQGSKEEEPEQWLLEGKGLAGERCLQRCNLNEEGSLEFQPEAERNEAEEERHGLSSKCSNQQNLSSLDFQVKGTTNLPYSPGQLPGDFLKSRADTNMNPGSSSMFGSLCKREFSHEDDIHHHSLNDNQKRMRNDDPWDHKPLEFDLCMEQIHSWMSKARMMYVEKEQALMNAHMNNQILGNGIQERESMIELMHQTKCEELHKRDLDIYRLERELYVMGNLLDGYKKALKETRRAFSEYRERCQLPDEPLYKDVGGTGGDVLSITELEKQKMQEEEENRMKRFMIEEKIKDFQISWFNEFEGYYNKVHLLDKRVLDFEIEVKSLKELFTKHKISEIQTCVIHE